MTAPGNPRVHPGHSHDRRCHCQEQCHDRGSVTAEFAVGLPGVVTTILLILGMLLAGATYVQCQEAARAGVREAILHASAEPAAAVAQGVAGPTAMVTVSTEGTWVRVRVAKPVLFVASPVTVGAELTAPMEQR